MCARGGVHGPCQRLESDRVVSCLADQSDGNNEGRFFVLVMVELIFSESGDGFSDGGDDHIEG